MHSNESRKHVKTENRVALGREGSQAHCASCVCVCVRVRITRLKDIKRVAPLAVWTSAVTAQASTGIAEQPFFTQAAKDLDVFLDIDVRRHAHARGHAR